MIEITIQKRSATSAVIECASKLTMIKEMAGIMGDCISGHEGRIENMGLFFYGLESICDDISGQLHDLLEYISDEEPPDTTDPPESG